ncbi:hypothetical protein ACTG23_16795 [Aeromonas enteropelogenes]|uniref:hypothetical protein n=1 Tax=Aeromonas enteropelogenes TaxID=29489 RepID=UPI003F7AFBA7
MNLSNNQKEIINLITDSIHYQLKKIDFLLKIKNNNHNYYVHRSIGRDGRESMSSQNDYTMQFTTDALLNAFSSLVDYYFVHFNLRLGANIEKIKNIQHNRMDNSFLRHSYRPIKNISSIEKLIEDVKRTEVNGIQISELFKNEKKHLHDVRQCIYLHAICKQLNNAGIKIDEKCLSLQKNSCGEIIFCVDERVRKYYEYMERFFCNKIDDFGAGPSIYLDLNAYLKHNSIPYISIAAEPIECNREIAYTCFEIPKCSTELLRKGGILSIVANADFDTLHSFLTTKDKDDSNFKSCGLTDIKNLFTLDKKNGVLSHDNNKLYFFVDQVLFIKTREATLIDSNKCFEDKITDISGYIDAYIKRFLADI